MKMDEVTLWEMMRFLYPNITLEDFYEILNTEGWENTIITTQINLRNRYELIDKYGGDGLGRYRELYEEYKNGELDKKIEKQKLKLKKLRKFI